jgi:hypothetical protein
MSCYGKCDIPRYNSLQSLLSRPLHYTGYRLKSTENQPNSHNFAFESDGAEIALINRHA